MKSFRLPTLAILLLAHAAPAPAATETYAIDPVHSTVGFSIRHLVSKFSGSFSKVTGTIMVDRDNLEKSSVEATVEVGSINTADDKRNTHLKSDDFFAALRFPAMTFKSTAWRKTGDDTFDVVGLLTIKDVTKTVVLKAKLLGFGPGMGNSQVCGWEITTTLKKSQFNMPGPAMTRAALGDDVTVSIGIEGVMKK